MTKKEFKSVTGLTEAQINGELIEGNLYLESLTTLPEGVTLNAGGYLDLRRLTIQSPTSKINRNKPIIIHNNIIIVDRVLSKLIDKKGNCYKVANLKGGIEYIVTDGGSKFAHGKTIKEAKADLIFKISDRDKSKFEGMDINKKMTFGESIECYRVITGSCEQGVKAFLHQKGITKGKFSVKEISDLTSGAYGNNEFNQFFKIS